MQLCVDVSGHADKHVVAQQVKQSLHAFRRLRFSVAFWHTLRGDGSDQFGSGTKVRPHAALSCQ